MDLTKEKCPICSSKIIKLWFDKNQFIVTSQAGCARFSRNRPKSDNHFIITFYGGEPVSYIKEIRIRGYLIFMDEKNMITIMYKDDTLLDYVRAEDEFFNSLGKIETLKNFRMML